MNNEKDYTRLPIYIPILGNNENISSDPVFLIYNWIISQCSYVIKTEIN